MPDRDKALSLIAQIERDAEARGYERGLEDGLKKAEEAVSEALNDVFLKLLDMKPPPPSLVATLRHMAARSPGHPERKPSGKAAVLDLIQRNPGLTGKQLVHRAENENTPIHERTLRTALHRLKIKDKAIFNEAGRWFAKEVPSAPLPFQREAPTK